MDNRQMPGGLAGKPSSARLSPSSIAAHFLLRTTFSVPGVDYRPMKATDLSPGITVIECPEERWIWLLAMSLYTEIDEARTSCAINAQPLPFARMSPAELLRARDDDAIGMDEDAEEVDDRSLVTILVPGDHERRPDYVPAGAGRKIEIDDAEQFLAGLANLMTVGSRTIIFVHNPEELAPVVRAASDRVLNAPRLEEATFRSMLNTVFDGSVSAAVPVPAHVDPVLLDLAFRAGDSARAYVERLNRLLENRGTVTIARPCQDSSQVPGFPRRLEDVHGMDEATVWARQLVVDLADYQMGWIGWGDVDRGAVFAGPPGTGKTRLASVIAAEAGVPLISGSAARWQQRNDGDNVQRMMAQTFWRAREAAPAILLIDELDSFWTRQGRTDHNSSYFTGLVNALLELLDGPVSREGVVVIGTTNNPDRVDPAVLRPGRLERVIEVPMPNFDDLRSIIDFYTGHRLSDAELDEAARLAISKRATGANVESWARAMRRRARHERREPAFADLVHAIDH